MKAVLWVMAFRNVRRRPRRSALTLGAVTVGVAAVVFLDGFGRGFLDLITSLLVDGRMGAVQVHHAQHLDAESLPLQYDLPSDSELAGRMAAVPGVRAVTPRLVFEGMLTNGLSSTMVMVTGVDPDREALVCPRRWVTLPQERFPQMGADGAVVGRTLVEGLGAQPGSVLTLAATTQGGAQNAIEITVAGLLGTTDALQSKRAVEVPLAFAQSLLAMEGRVTEYAIAVDEGRSASLVSDRLAAALGPGYSVHTWVELMPEISDGVAAMATMLGLVMALLALLVLSAVANTLMMSIHERQRELGMMMAMGMRRKQVLQSVVAEAAVLGLVGAVVGVALGWLLVAVLHHTGLPLKPPESEIDNHLRPVGSALAMALAAVGCVLGAMVAALYPARRAARLTPVEALRND